MLRLKNQWIMFVLVASNDKKYTSENSNVEDKTVIKNVCKFVVVSKISISREESKGRESQKWSRSAKTWWLDVSQWNQSFQTLWEAKSYHGKRENDSENVWKSFWGDGFWWEKSALYCTKALFTKALWKSSLILQTFQEKFCFEILQVNHLPSNLNLKFLIRFFKNNSNFTRNQTNSRVFSKKFDKEKCNLYWACS